MARRLPPARIRLSRPLAGSLVALLTLLLGCTPAKPKPTLLVYGDSLTVQSEAALAFFYGSQYHLVFRAQGGTAMCDWATHAAADRIAYRPTRVVLAFTGNVDDCVLPDYHRDKLAGVVANYDTNLRTFAAGFSGLPVEVIAPPAMNNTSHNYQGWFPYNGNPALLAMYQQVSTELHLNYSTVADDTLTPGHVYTAYRPPYGTHAAPVLVRAPDGIHLTAEGTVYYAHAIAG